MLLSTRPDIKEIIVRALSGGAIPTLTLQEEVASERKVTKQGFYKALRELIRDEVVVKNKQTVLLNNIWLQRLEAFIGSVNQNYFSQASEELVKLKEGDEMVFKFNSLLSLDLMWMHYFHILAKKVGGPIVFFNSHNFWSLLRSDIENTMYQWLKDNNKETYMIIGYNTKLDRETAGYVGPDYNIKVAYEENPSLPVNNFTTVFGDYIMSTVLDHTLVGAIHNLYLAHEKWDKTVEEKVADIVSRMRRSKVVIERNKKKAEALRKKLMKYFMFW